MYNKHRRILWLLNHRTLMPYEAPLIQRLGFEIYVPKVYPAKGFRSFGVDASYDETLTLPPDVLALLNGFNLYEDPWTPEIIAALNRYFGAAFVIPHGRGCPEAVDNFEGQIVLRAFGLNNDKTYKRFLEDLYGPLILRKIAAIEHRFWFGEGYEHLHEVEEPLFVRRSLFTPIGIPDSFFSTARQWTGIDKKILFVCPNAVTDSYYSSIYRKFKQDFGDLPHVIVGAQDVPVDDPHMAGFVSDAELKRLYLECAVLYYHSTEIRHIHYSPIEAAINGMPVVFHEGSLLDRLSRGATKGRASSVEEARSLIERILAGDEQLISEIKKDEEDIAFYFSDAYCGPMWKQQMEERGFFDAMRPKPRLQTLLTEWWRDLRMSKAHGRLRVDPFKRAVQPTRATLSADEAKKVFGASLFDGIRFNENFPDMVDYVDGVRAAEEWGRWSSGDKITIVLKHLLQGEFRFYLHAVGYMNNAGVPVPVRIGDQTRTVILSPDIRVAAPLWMHFSLEQPSNVIEITVPHPLKPGLDTRTLGVGMVAAGVAPMVSLALDAARATLGASLQDGWEIGAPGFPPFIDSAQGLCDREGWGRWSSGDEVIVELNHTLDGRFRLLLRIVGYGPNVGATTEIAVGGTTQSFEIPGEPQEMAFDFELEKPSNLLRVRIPQPTNPPNDTRSVGIAFYSLRAERFQ